VKLHVILRSSGGENTKHRPPGYSKHTALASLIRSVREAGQQTEIVYLNDGEIPGDRARLMRETGEVLSLPAPPRHLDHPRFRLVRSYRTAIGLSITRGWPDEDVVYIGEDDWLFRADAFWRLRDAVPAVEIAEYFAFVGTILEHDSDIRYVDDCIWQLAYSITSSFAVRIGTLRRDRALHRVGLIVAGDTQISLALRGVRPFAWSRVVGDFLQNPRGLELSPKQRLGVAARRTSMNGFAMQRSLRRHPIAAPYEPLAMHWEVPYRGHRPDLVDWDAVAAETRAWLTSYGAAKRPPTS
jgi:hypothetical protein